MFDCWLTLSSQHWPASGEGEEDNDNRKLRKPDRMRMVVKNKDEGTNIILCPCHSHNAHNSWKAY